ncbi:MAG: MBL fold metallo-hydrolase [Chloroflexi bacterium]|nr:MBL fold metallo-hydrolase [Chloroflexota bacterium]
MYIQQFFIEGIGCASYLVGCEAHGVGAVVDPDRDVQKYLDVALSKNLKITHIIETHLHADHVSGNTELAGRTGATIYVHELGKAEFAHQPLHGGDVIELGNIRLHVRHTPGHTPESITLLVADTTRADEPWMALTGDTLFVGDIGRPDLVGIEAARGLAGQMYDSLHNEFLTLNDGVLIYPGHGAGSLCGKSIGSVRSTSLGYEKHHNPALAPREKDEFVDYATSQLPEQPANHTRIKAMNRTGPRALGELQVRGLSIQDAIPYFRQGAALLDTRPKADYLDRHIPGAVHLEADDQLSNRIGFALSPDMPVILLLQNPEDYAHVRYSLARVGFDEVVGYLADSLATWEAMGLPIASGDVHDIEPAELDKLLNSAQPPIVVDVRESWEYAQGHVPSAVLMPLGQLGKLIDTLDAERPIAVICATGSRSQSATALFGKKGFKKVYNVLGGTMYWMQNGLPIERGTKEVIKHG